MASRSRESHPGNCTTPREEENDVQGPRTRLSRRGLRVSTRLKLMSIELTLKFNYTLPPPKRDNPGNNSLTFHRSENAIKTVQQSYKQRQIPFIRMASRVESCAPEGGRKGKRIGLRNGEKD